MLSNNALWYTYFFIYMVALNPITQFKEIMNMSITFPIKINEFNELGLTLILINSGLSIQYS
jgi:hypothetical protein